ncbi:DUF1848 domain-containing protein [Roseburia sp. 499]|uniref:DUF1848 domain-containing protein n=1 Tax=Roseburia sp. 499 TaxID=1261634 RepID=UPI0009511842|nr:DUF1848 domain-containing protein [Roseburia sp. 499]WVK70536.1 DUF1848 domain-containing protein [Roseburia sp. 499]
MILSVSRRTDIPNYYSEWFFNRIKEGYLYVRNPMNFHQISKISLSPELVDCIVFWTKNPKPMLNRLIELKDYHYYFQFTLTGYGKNIEPNVPHKKKEMIPIFQELSERIGSERVVWRYDPILLTERYTTEYHIKAFEEIVRELEGYTKKVVISFVDMYDKMKHKGVYFNEMKEEECRFLAEKMSEIARAHHMEIASCAEKIDLRECGVKHNSCIDKELIEEIIGCQLNVNKDKNQREACGCVESIEVGTYDTCLNGCQYCYANRSEQRIKNIISHYNPLSPLLCGEITEGDKITERKVKSFREEQLSLF